MLIRYFARVIPISLGTVETVRGEHKGAVKQMSFPIDRGINNDGDRSTGCSYALCGFDDAAGESVFAGAVRMDATTRTLGL